LESVRLLWIDLRARLTLPSLGQGLPAKYVVCRIAYAEAITEAFAGADPAVACFDFDFPDARRLQVLGETALKHPQLPIVMLTEQHSEKLAVWALRTRVWDYLIKPLPMQQLCACLDSLWTAPKPCRLGPAPEPPPAPSAIPSAELRIPIRRVPVDLSRAIPFVQSNFAEKISLAMVANLCGMGQFQFSRAFKRDHGLTFRDYLLRYRVGRAAELLREERTSVTEAAFSVGFSDLSYFARIFRRYTGANPSEYREQLRQQNETAAHANGNVAKLS
jgi:AraC-like DNA-binding protein